MGSSVLEATQLSSGSSIVNQLCMNEAHSFFLIFEVPTFYFRVKDIKDPTICYHHHSIK